MANQIQRAREATATVIRVLKIMEPEVQTAHDRFKTHPSDISALHFIGDNAGCQASALARHLGVAPTTVSSMLDRMERAGLTERARSASDRRSIALWLTEEGRTAREQIISEELATSRRLLEALPRDRRAEFVTSLETIASELLRQEKGPSQID